MRAFYRRLREQSPVHWDAFMHTWVVTRYEDIMTVLKDHQRFAVAGHDTGMLIAYALAADYPDRVSRLAVAETTIPGVAPSPPLFAPGRQNDVF